MNKCLKRLAISVVTFLSFTGASALILSAYILYEFEREEFYDWQIQPLSDTTYQLVCAKRHREEFRGRTIKDTGVKVEFSYCKEIEVDEFIKEVAKECPVNEKGLGRCKEPHWALEMGLYF